MLLQKLAGSLNSFLALLALMLFAFGYSFAGAVVWGAGYLFLLARQLRVFHNTGWTKISSLQEVTRIIFTLALVVLLIDVAVPKSMIAIFVLAATALLINVNHKIGSIHGPVSYRIANFDTFEERVYPTRLRQVLNLTLLISPLVYALFIFFSVSGWWFLTVFFIPVLLLLVVVFLLLKRKSGMARIKEDLRSVLEEYEPKFVVYWSAPPRSKHQLEMWLEHLQKANEKFFILVRTSSTFNEAISVTSEVPIVWAKTLSDVDSLILESLTTVVYVNNASHNMQMVRHSQLKHIQLLHGDSEKTPSYNPVTAMYDRVYVAGQAAIDRYSDNGVSIPAEKFVIVGRPQVTEIERAATDVSEIKSKTVLYAPTWRGFFQDADYTSLDYFYDTVKSLLDLKTRIIFRPHPYTNRDEFLSTKVEAIQKLLMKNKDETGIAHVWGVEAEETLSLTDCFNESDAMIADVSSVVSDFLFSEKPLGLATGNASDLEYLKKWKLTQGAYIFTADHESNTAELQKLLVTDPLKNTRLQMRDHYLGDFDPDNYDETFVRVLRDDIKPI